MSLEPFGETFNDEFGVSFEKAKNANHFFLKKITIENWWNVEGLTISNCVGLWSDPVFDFCPSGPKVARALPLTKIPSVKTYRRVNK